MTDLFEGNAARVVIDTPKNSYSAEHIEVLEGLEPVRKRPGMYIGGVDDRAFHHLAAEILDNSMDEAVAGHATKITFDVGLDNTITISDNGRGIPVDQHPKYPGKSALEVILTTLHSGGKFSDAAYSTSGGLHGVGISVVNALSHRMEVAVTRNKTTYTQTYSRGFPTSTLTSVPSRNQRGTVVTFQPDPDIFGANMAFDPARLYRMARSKAYLHPGVAIEWKCHPDLIPAKAEGAIPAEETIQFTGGIKDFVQSLVGTTPQITSRMFSGEAQLADGLGRVEWAIAWPENAESRLISYANTIPTPQGGTHETGLRSALTRSLKGFAEMCGQQKKASQILGDDIFADAIAVLSLFLKNPQFQGQTKEKLASIEAARLVDAAIKDPFDHWLAANPADGTALLEAVLERADERQRKRDARDLARKTPTRRLRLPGKLSDCSRTNPEGTEIFIVEGDSAGGSAKQARNRETQAILPLRGKILNVASASADKIRANQEIQDLTQALGCGLGKDCDPDKMRYERIIIMTDADVDGAHIASLLMTFIYQFLRPVLQAGRVYLAMPPLYRLTSGANSFYAKDDAHKDQLMKKHFSGSRKVDISRFKGLGEMPAKQLKETTMDPKSRSLMQVKLPLPDADQSFVAAYAEVSRLVDDLMGRDPEKRFIFLQENAVYVKEIDA